MVPTFTERSIGQGGTQLYPGSIAAPTPQTFDAASPPTVKDGFGVSHHHKFLEGNPGGDCALHPGPYPPDSSRQRGYGASTTGSLTLYLLTSLDEPAPSGSAGTSRLCRGHPPRRSPDQAAPSFSRAAATARGRRSLTTSRSIQRLVAHLTGTQDEHDGGIGREDVGA